MLFYHLGPKAAPENSLGSTGKPWNQTLYLRICITGLILFLDISSEERYISSQISVISVSSLVLVKLPFPHYENTTRIRLWLNQAYCLCYRKIGYKFFFITVPEM